jgi:hypothetical protein
MSQTPEAAKSWRSIPAISDARERATLARLVACSSSAAQRRFHAARYSSSFATS